MSEKKREAVALLEQMPEDKVDVVIEFSHPGTLQAQTSAHSIERINEN